jgi:hypothetical protein
MIVMPASASATPVTSQGLGRIASIVHSHASAAAT